MINPLKFCLCTTFYPPYNSDADGWYVQRLANGLAKLGHDVTVVHNPDAYESLTGKQITEEYDDHPNITIKRITSPLRLLSLLAVHQTGKPYGQKSLLQECFKEPFDVIHYYNVSLLGGPEIFSYGRSRIKIGGFNDHWLVCPMHLLWKYTGEVCEKPQCFTCSLRYGKPPQLWRHTGLLETMTKHIDAFLGPSLFTIRKHRERGFNRPMIHLPSLYTIPEKAGTIDNVLPENRPFFLLWDDWKPTRAFKMSFPYSATSRTISYSSVVKAAIANTCMLWPRACPMCISPAHFPKTGSKCCMNRRWRPSFLHCVIRHFVISRQSPIPPEPLSSPINKARLK